MTRQTAKTRPGNLLRRRVLRRRSPNLHSEEKAAKKMRSPNFCRQGTSCDIRSQRNSTCGARTAESFRFVLGVDKTKWKIMPEKWVCRYNRSWFQFCHFNEIGSHWFWRGAASFSFKEVCEFPCNVIICFVFDKFSFHFSESKTVTYILRLFPQIV